MQGSTRDRSEKKSAPWHRRFVGLLLLLFPGAVLGGLWAPGIVRIVPRGNLCNQSFHDGRVLRIPGQAAPLAWIVCEIVQHQPIAFGSDSPRLEERPGVGREADR